MFNTRIESALLVLIAESKNSDETVLSFDSNLMISVNNCSFFRCSAVIEATKLNQETIDRCAKQLKKVSLNEEIKNLNSTFIKINITSVSYFDTPNKNEKNLIETFERDIKNSLKKSIKKISFDELKQLETRAL